MRLLNLWPDGQVVQPVRRFVLEIVFALLLVTLFLVIVILQNRTAVSDVLRAPELPEGTEIANISLEELGEQMREADFIIPYGLPKQSHEPPAACSELEAKP